jgi:hypothetical protein
MTHADYNNLMAQQQQQIQQQQQQIAQLIAGQQGAQGPGPGAAGAGAAAVGQLPACNLGRDKMRRYKKWSDWRKEAESKMAFLGITQNSQKIAYIKSCAGAELLTFWEKEARVRFEGAAANEALGIVAQEAQTFNEIVTETERVLLAIVNRDRAVIDLLNISQGDKTVMEFLAEVEDQVKLCRANVKRITEDDLARMALIAGFRDRNLAEKALAEEYDLKTTIQVAVTRETSKANAKAMQGKPAQAEVKKLREGRSKSAAQASDSEDGSWTGNRIGDLEQQLAVLKVRQHNKYSGRYKAEGGAGGGGQNKCRNCDLTHQEGECRAPGQTCHRCQGVGHYARAAACPGRGKEPPAGRPRGRRTYSQGGTRRVEYGSTDSEATDPESSRRIQSANRVWPGVQEGAQITNNHKVEGEKEAKDKKASRWVTVRLAGCRVRLFVDTGCRYTLIPPEMYREEMGELVPAKRALRGWGASGTLDVKGMFRTEVTTARGATSGSWVYVVGGHKPEPLLGDKDAERLGIIKFRPEGREPTLAEERNRRRVSRLQERGRSDTRGGARAREGPEASIPGKLRRAGITIETGRSRRPPVEKKDKTRAWSIVNAYRDTVFGPGVGEIKMEPVRLEHEEGFRPVQPQRRSVPYHYRGRLTAHLDMMKREGVIEDVDPKEPIDAVLNLVITDKKAAGEIRMNVDATPLNKGAKMTKYHVKTAAEVRHELEGAAYFSELDMGYGFHQVPLSPDTAKLAVFQSHQGLHRFKRLFFGPRASSGIFHNIVQKCFRGVSGVTTIHDNILVHGATPAEHHENLKNCLQRAKETGVRLRLDKSTIFENQVDWFGRVFSATGVSASPGKIENIVKAGRPESVEEVRSLLQACSYNARFAFDHSESRSYTEITAPLREMLGSGEVFGWTEEREESYQALIRVMSAETTLRPFNPSRPTHFVSDASPLGIAASVYQEQKGGTWVPVDHVDRALSAAERGWDSQIEWESLAKCWGMRMLRSYLVGQTFTSWGDHKPLVPLYNNLAAPASIRLNAHRRKVQDLSFDDKFLKGKENPCDYRSRKPNAIHDLSQEERDKLEIEDTTDVMVMKVVMDDMPAALPLEVVKEAARNDSAYRQLLAAVREGRRPNGPELAAYKPVWGELSIVDGLLMRGERLVVPDYHLGHDIGTLRQWCVELGHEGHQGAAGTKRLLRTRLWWPGMDRLAEARVEECLPCQAAVDSHHRDPLQPSTAPRLPMEWQSGDHWGPTPDGCHVLVVMDLLTRFPEVAVVKGTKAEENIHALDTIFSRHSPPKVFLTDGGPPFNTGPDHPLQKYFSKMGIRHVTTRSAEDPEANGVCESFMKHLKKTWHTALVEHRDPQLELNKHLRAFRATPHPTTGAAPGDLLYSRHFRTKLPDLRVDSAASRADITTARRRDEEQKAVMKKNKDKGRNVKPHNIRVGDHVLAERKVTKQDSPYDPEQYTVTEVIGTQVEATRGREVRRRDAQRWKRVNCRPPRKFERPELQGEESGSDADVGPPRARTGQAAAAARDPGQAARDPAPIPEGRPQVEPPPPRQEYPERQDIQARLRRNPNIILAETLSNRPPRVRTQPKPMYVPDPLPRKKNKKKN